MDQVRHLEEKVSDLETELLAARYIIMALAKRAPDKMLKISQIELQAMPHWSRLIVRDNYLNNEIVMAYTEES